MPCYCKKIRKCKADIKRIKSARIYLKKVCQSNDWDMSNHLSNLELNHSLCITPDNLSSLSDAILKSNKTFSVDAEELLAACDNILDDLEDDLSDMERADDRYHDDDD